MRLILLLAIIGAAYAASPVGPSRIIGGYDTSVALHPYMANVKQIVLGVWAHHVCGGTIINNFYILTAAQCVYNQATSAFSVVVGSSLIDGTGGTSHNLANHFAHPAFDPRTLVSDIAILRVSNAIITTVIVASIDIAGATYSLPTSTPVSALGWGSEGFFGSSNEQLQKVDYYTIDIDVCNALYQHTSYPEVTATMLCVGALEGSQKGICDGDTGGPLLHGKVLVGVSSWGSHCNADSYNHPDVSTSIASYVAWIVANAV